MKTNTIKKTTAGFDVLVTMAMIFTLSTIRNSPMLHMVGGIVLALLAIASFSLRIINFAKNYQTSTRNERLFVLANIAIAALWLTGLILGIAVFANGVEITRALRDINPTIWAMSRAHIATAVMATIMTIVHIVRYIVKFIRAGTPNKQAAKNGLEEA